MNNLFKTVFRLWVLKCTQVTLKISVAVSLVNLSIFLFLVVV